MKIGIDLIEIKRVQQSIKNPRFITRVFSLEEQQLFETRKWRAETVAANFAAKEAFAKALGTGVRGFSLNEVSVLRDEFGAPYLQLSGKAAEVAFGKTFSVSLTHTKELAQAIVLMEEHGMKLL